MKYLKELQTKKIFSLSDVTKLTNGNENTAKSLLQQYKKVGYIVSIRKNLYGALDLASGNVLASRYEIATATSSTSYLSHHTALEFHGIANQVFFEVTIASEEKLRPFEYDGIAYRPIKSKGRYGVIVPPNAPKVRVTDIERTIIDCISDIDLAGGVEELLKSIELIPELNEDRLIEYLEMYNQRNLWQRAGYVLESFRERLRLSDVFFDKCKESMGIRKNYFVRESEFIYHPEWRLYAPEDLLAILNEGDDVIV